MAAHSVGVTIAVVLERFLMTTLGADSTVPVLGCTPSPEELISLISPVRRRRAVVFPKRGAPRRIAFYGFLCGQELVVDSQVIKAFT